MSTRNTTLVIDREHAKEHKEGFAVNPEEVIKYSYVNMYLHHDGYLRWQGVQLANWIEWQEDNNYLLVDGAKVASKLVYDFYYDSCYIYPTKPNQIDANYTYIIWTGKDDVWISCWDNYNQECKFVGQPKDMIEKYWDDMDYTEWGKEIVNTMKL
tara:strand:+ start:53 stop:517 length:465 start_codon:yes stop_codon:yes gene_type:complete